MAALSFEDKKSFLLAKLKGLGLEVDLIFDDNHKADLLLVRFFFDGEAKGSKVELDIHVAQQENACLGIKFEEWILEKDLEIQIN